MRFGLIGCGWIVERDHIPAMLQSDKVQVVGTADVSPERARLAGRIAGIDEGACLSDYRDLLDRDDVEIVSVASPPSTRLKIVRDAAAAGKHIVCEKPLALSLADADEMIAVCEAAHVTLAVYHNYLYYFEPGWRPGSSQRARSATSSPPRSAVSAPGHGSAPSSSGLAGGSSRRWPAAAC
jgi:predicted dehydrogenase